MEKGAVKSQFFTRKMDRCGNYGERKNGKFVEIRLLQLCKPSKKPSQFFRKKPSVEKPVENVEKSGLSTGIFPFTLPAAGHRVTSSLTFPNSFLRRLCVTETAGQIKLWGVFAEIVIRTGLSVPFPRTVSRRR